MISSVSDKAGAPDLKKTRRQRPTTDGRVDRLPPHAAEMEQGLLGCQLLAPNDCIAEVIEKCGNDITQLHYDLRHQLIQDVLIEMFNTQKPIDIITFQQELADRKVLDHVGGIAYLMQLQEATPSFANLSYYLEIVREKLLLRQMLAVCTNVAGQIYEHEGAVEQLCDEVERDILRISESRIQGHSTAMKDLVPASLQAIENMFSRNGEISGLPTGIPDFDRMTDGLHGSEMIVIAARPSMGKTSLAMCWVEHVVLFAKQPAAVFSLEMSAESLSTRMMCSLARVNLKKIREGFMAETDFPKLTSAAGKLSRAPIYIDDTAGLSILQLRAKARRFHQQHGIKLIVIDYLQLLHAPGKRAQENRQQEVSDISSGIKALAKELKIPIVVLAQLNRELERREGKPRLSDLRESGSIEQDADLVGLLYKPGKTDDDETAPDSPDGIPVNLLIAKQRNGPTGDINLTFLKSYTRFEAAAKIADEDVPMDK